MQRSVPDGARTARSRLGNLETQDLFSLSSGVLEVQDQGASFRGGFSLEPQMVVGFRTGHLNAP